MMTQNEKKSFAIALVVLGVVAIVLIIWLLFFRNTNEITGPVIHPTEITAQPEVIEADPIPIRAVTAEEAAAKTVAQNFAERFGTYSTDAPYINYKEIEDLSTIGYYASLIRLPQEEGDYRGVTTRALAVTPLSGSEETGSVEYRVSAQRETFTGNRSSSTVEYVAARVTVVQEGTVWLVNAFTWE
jgi:hypothetical protein